MDIKIKTLKSYQNTSQRCNGKGIFVGQDGETYNILDFKDDGYLTIERLATALSRIYRYAGNSQMTVAQHCVRGAEALLLMGDPLSAYDFLMHEISEPIGIGDIGQPLKVIIKDIIKPIEHSIEETLSKRFGYRYPMPSIVKDIDINLAQDEMMMMATNVLYDYWDSSKAYERFMETYHKLDYYIKVYQNKELI